MHPCRASTRAILCYEAMSKSATHRPSEALKFIVNLAVTKPMYRFVAARVACGADAPNARHALLSATRVHFVGPSPDTSNPGALSLHTHSNRVINIIRGHVIWIRTVHTVLPCLTTDACASTCPAAPWVRTSLRAPLAPHRPQDSPSAPATRRPPFSRLSIGPGFPSNHSLLPPTPPPSPPHHA